MDSDKVADHGQVEAEEIEGTSAAEGLPGDQLQEEDLGPAGGKPEGGNATASSSEAPAEGPEGAVRLAQVAANKVNEIATAEGLAAFRLRVKVVGGGCAGFAYALTFDEMSTDSSVRPATPEDPVAPMDVLLQTNGVSLIVDQMSLMYLYGTEIDYVESLTGEGFKFNNPNVSTTCGCGQSFQV